MADVVDITKKREDKPKADEAEPIDPLAEAEARNKANKEREAKERAAANKSVLRSYRIKY